MCKCKPQKLPTDLDVLRCIYEMHAPEYPKNIDDQVRGENDPYVPIDIKKIAARMKAQPELIFGRIYYHLNKKYSYEGKDGVTTPFFLLKIPQTDKRHGLQFPLLTSVLAGLESEHSKASTSITLSKVAIGISLSTFIVGLLTFIYKVFLE